MVQYTGIVAAVISGGIEVPGIEIALSMVYGSLLLFMLAYLGWPLITKRR